MKLGYYIYAVGRHEGPVKIGITKNLGCRVTTIQTSCPFNVSLLHYRRCRDVHHARKHERDIHAVYEHKRLRGEWFDIDGELATEALDTSFDIEEYFAERAQQESEAFLGAHPVN